MEKTDEIDSRTRYQKLSDRKEGLFQKLDRFRTETGFDVAAVVFSVDGSPPSFFGDASVLERFMADDVGGGGDLDLLDTKTVESVKLGFQEMEEEVNRCVDCEKLVKMKIELIKLKESRLKGVLTDEETEARSLESSSEFLKMLDARRTIEIKDLAMSVMQITFQCDAEAFFICATKRSPSYVSRFHTCPGDGPAFLRLIHKFMKYQVVRSKPALSKNVDVAKVASPTIVTRDPSLQSDDAGAAIPSFQGVSASAKHMVQRLVDAEMSQSIIPAGSLMSDAGVAAVNQMTETILADDKRRSATTISKAEMVNMINSVVKLIDSKLEMAKAALIKQLGINKPVTTAEPDIVFVEDSDGNLVTCRKFL